MWNFPVMHFFSIWIKCKSSDLDVSNKKGVLVDFTKLTGNPFHRTFIFNKKRRCKFFKISKNNYFEEQLSIDISVNMTFYYRYVIINVHIRFKYSKTWNKKTLFCHL